MPQSLTIAKANKQKQTKCGLVCTLMKLSIRSSATLVMVTCHFPKRFEIVKTRHTKNAASVRHILPSLFSSKHIFRFPLQMQTLAVLLWKKMNNKAEKEFGEDP